MSVVGRAYVTVRAVTRQVPGDVKSGLDKALGDVDKTLGDKMGAKIGDNIGKGIEKSDVGKSVEKSVSQYDVDRHGRDVGTALGHAIGESLFGSASSIKDKLRAAVPDHDRESERKGFTFGRAVGVSVAAGMVKAIPGAAVMGLILPLIADAIPIISALGASTVALTSTLGPAMAGAAAAGGGALFGLLTTVGTLTLAFKSDADAVLHMTKVLGPARDMWRGIGQDISQRLLPVLAEAGNRISFALGPTAAAGMNETAKSVGGIARQFTSLAESPMFQGNIANMWEHGAAAVRDFGAAGINAASALSSIGNAAAPLTTRFSSWVREMSAGAAKSLELSDSTGRLDVFFNKASDTAAEWGRILGNVGSALFNVFRIGTAEGGGLLDKLEGITDRFDHWTESISGRESIAKWFSDATPVIEDLRGVMVGLVKGVGNWSSSLSGARGTLQGISNLLPNVGEILGSLSQAFGGVFEAVGPTVERINELAPALQSAADSIFASLGPALDDIGPPLIEVGTALLSIVESAAPLISMLGTGLGPVLSVVADAFTGLSAILDALPGPMGTLVLGFAGIKIAMSVLASGTGGLALKFQALQAQFAIARTQAALTSASFVGLRASATLATAALGPIGIALAVASTALGFFMTRQSGAKETTDALTVSFDENTGALTRMGEQQAIADIASKGLYDSAGLLSLSYNDVTQAVLGNEAAYNKLQGAYNTYLAGINYGSPGWRSAMTDGEQAEYEKITALVHGVDDLSGSYATQSKAAKQAADAHNQVQNSMVTALRPASQLAQQMARLGDTAGGSARELRYVRTAILSVNTAATKAMSAEIGFKQAIHDATVQIRDNKKTLNINSQAGRDNRNVLIRIADAASQVTGSTKKQQAAMREARNKVLDLAKASTKNDDVAKKLTNRIFDLTKQYGKVPKDVKSDVKAPGIEGEIQRAKILKSTLEDIDGRTFSYTVRRTNAGGGGHEPGEKAAGRVMVGASVGTRGGGGGPRGVLGASGGGTTVSAPNTPRRVLKRPEGAAVVYANTYNYEVTVVNPRTERTSDSIPRALRRTRDLGLRGGDDDR